MDKNTKKKVNWQAVFLFMLMKLAAYAVWSAIIVSLFSWAGVIPFNFRLIVALTVLIFSSWLFLQNFFGSRRTFENNA